MLWSCGALLSNAFTPIGIIHFCRLFVIFWTLKSRKPNFQAAVWDGCFDIEFAIKFWNEYEKPRATPRSPPSFAFGLSLRAPYGNAGCAPRAHAGRAARTSRLRPACARSARAAFPSWALRLWPPANCGRGATGRTLRRAVVPLAYGVAD